MDLLREQLAQFRHLRAPEHESGGRSPRTVQNTWGGWTEVYPLVETLQEVGDESEEEYNSDSEARDAWISEVSDPTHVENSGVSLTGRYCT